MNIPLNIDWQQILLHLFNFVILIAGLYLLLYKPVKKFMDQRTAHYQEAADEAAAKLAQAEAMEAEYQAKLADTEAEISEKRAEAEAALARETASQLQAAKEQADKLVSDARVTAQTERERIVAAAQKDNAGLAAEAAEKLISGENGLDGAYGSFLSAAKGDGSHGEG